MNKTLPTLEQMPPVPVGVEFQLNKVENVSQPHLYCITPKHVSWASKNWGGILSADAIRDAEKHGAGCDICLKSGRGMLTYDQHETLPTLFISVPLGVKDLNSIAGLHKYLFENKATFEKLGIQGFAFPSQ